MWLYWWNTLDYKVCSCLWSISMSITFTCYSFTLVYTPMFLPMATQYCFYLYMIWLPLYLNPNSTGSTLYYHRMITTVPVMIESYSLACNHRTVIIVGSVCNNCSEAVVSESDWVRVLQHETHWTINYLIVQCVSLLVPFPNSSWRLEFIHRTLESAVDWVINAVSIHIQ